MTSNSPQATESNTTAKPTVGWIGLGDQGLPMATAVAAAGFALHAWGRRPTSLDGLSDVQHVGHDDIAGLAKASDIVGICVDTDDDVMGLLTGGLLEGLRPGSVVVNHGTGTPSAARKFTETAKKSDVEVLDAPVSGGRAAAQEHRLITMVGGAQSTAARCRPVFDSFSRDVVYLGGSGAGQITKLFNNALMITNQAAIADIFQLAAKSDVDPVQLFNVLKEASAGSTVLGLFNTMITTETVDHLAKVQGLDLEIFDNAMREEGLDASAITARARTGNDRLADVVAILNP